MKLIAVRILESQIKSLDRLVEERYYSSRAEAIRSAIGFLIDDHRSFKRIDYGRKDQS